MRKALIRAKEILQQCNLSSAPINIDKIIELEGLSLDDWQFAGRIKEAYLGDSIGIKNTVDPRKRRELIAHALGHHFLHAGNHLYFEQHDQFITFKQEHEAQCFAAELAKYPSGSNAPDKANLPNPSLYRHTFFSPDWSPDFAGFSVLASALLTVVILLRFLAAALLRVLLRRHYSSI